MIKAYKAWDVESCEFGSLVVFAENIKEAKKIAVSHEMFEDSRWIDVRVKRYPEMDEHYRGYPTIDWYNDQDRIALVSLGWSCLDPLLEECSGCPARSMCRETEIDEYGT